MGNKIFAVAPKHFLGGKLQYVNCKGQEGKSSSPAELMKQQKIIWTVNRSVVGEKNVLWAHNPIQ